MASQERGSTFVSSELREPQDAQKTPLSQELQKTVSAIDSIKARLEERIDGNPQDNLLIRKVVDSLDAVRGEIYSRVPELIWQNGHTQVEERPSEIKISELLLPNGDLEKKSEEELVNKARLGDESALSKLYEHYFPRVYNYIYYRTSNTQNSEDLAQDVLIKTFGAIENFEWRDVPFSAWIFRSAHNALVSFRRRSENSSTRRLLSEPFFEDHPGVLRQGEGSNSEDIDAVIKKLDLGANLQRVVEACRTLPRIQKEIIFLRFFSDLKVAETAAVLDKGEGNVKVLQHKAIQKLRRILNPDDKVQTKAPSLPKERIEESVHEIKEPKITSSEQVPTKDQDRLVSVSHLSNIIQVYPLKIIQTAKTLGVELPRVGGLKTHHLSIDNARLLSEYLIQQKIAEQVFFMSEDEMVSFNEAARQLDVDVGMIVDAAYRQDIPIAAFAQKQQALERLTRYSQGGSFEEFEREFEKPRKKSEVPPEGALTSEDCRKKLSVHLMTLYKLRDRTNLTPLRIGKRVFFTREHQEIIEGYIRGRKEARENRNRQKAEEKIRRVQPPEGYITSGEFLGIIGMTRQRWHSIKEGYSVASLRIGQRVYFLREDALAVKNERDQIKERKARRKVPKGFEREEKTESEKGQQVKLSDFAANYNLSLEKVFEATKSLGWKFDEEVGEITLDSWHETMLKGYLLIRPTKKRQTDKAPKKVRDASQGTSKSPVLRPEGLLSTEDLLDRLGISHQTFLRKGLNKMVAPIRVGRKKFYTRKNQEVLKDALGERHQRPRQASQSPTNGDFPKQSEGWSELYEPASWQGESIGEVSHRSNFGETPKWVDVSRRLPGELPAAKQPDEAGKRFLENRERILEEGKRRSLNGETSYHVRGTDRKPLFRIGTQFTILHPRLGLQTYTIVPQEQIDAKEGKISGVAPLALAISDSDLTPNSKVKVTAPTSDYEVELVSVAVGEGGSLYGRAKRPRIRKTNSVIHLKERPANVTQVSESRSQREAAIESSQETNLLVMTGECAHSWRIETPNGPTSQGQCKSCGEEREFKNSFNGKSWLEKEEAKIKRNPTSGFT